MSTRNGKIARLPRFIRDQLGERIQNGELGVKLVEWLNSDPQVQETLRLWFEGRPINEQNLTEWKQGGYQEWLRHQEACEWVRTLAEDAEELEVEAEDANIGDRLSVVLTAELARTARKVMEDITDPRQRLDCLLLVMDRLNAVRRADQRSRRLQMEQEKSEAENEREEQEESKRRIKAAKKKVFDALWAPINVAAMAAVFGGDDNAWERAALWVETENDLPTGALHRKQTAASPESSPVRPNQTESNQIKPENAPAAVSDLAPEGGGR